MQWPYLKMALAVILAWVPALFWLVFAATGVVLGLSGLFSSDPLGGLVFIALGLGGILGFVSLSILCWTRKSLNRLLVVFLAWGALSLLVASGYLMLADKENLIDPETVFKLLYFVACPLGYACHQIWCYLRAPGTAQGGGR